MMIPKTQKAPVVFLYDFGGNEQIFAIAPRYNVDELFNDNKKGLQSTASESKK